MKKYTIFYVDDNVDYADIFFEEHSIEFDIRIFHHPDNLIANLAMINPDLILLDVHMPYKSGLELFKEIRNLGGFSITPIMFLSADDTDQTVLDHLKLMPEDFLFKTDSSSLVRARILNRLKKLETLKSTSEQVHKVSEELIEYSNLKMDNNAFKVRIDDNRVNLTNIEYRMLFYILTNMNNNLLKSDLVSFVWGGSFVAGRTVNTHLSNLRSKISSADFLIKVNRAGDHIRVVSKG